MQAEYELPATILKIETSHFTISLGNFGRANSNEYFIVPMNRFFYPINLENVRRSVL